MRKNVILSISITLAGIVHSLPLSPTSPTSPTSSTSSTTTFTCHGSSDEQAVNLALFRGGPGFILELCPGAVISIVGGPVFFAAAGQIIMTQGEYMIFFQLSERKL